MPIYNSKSALVKELKGIHLYHFTLSNCSQRVRLALAEKGLSWTSRHLDLTKNEHITDEYQQINPSGVVPTLIVDGEVVVESNDILFYLEQRFPNPPLVPKIQCEYTDMEAHIGLASKAQGAIKVLTYDMLFRHVVKFDEDDIQFFENNRQNKDVVEFMHDFVDDSEIWSIRVESSKKEVIGVLGRLDKALSKKPWLTGDNYGLADVSWVVNLNRLIKFGFATEEFQFLREWFERCSSRKTFADAVINYQESS